MIIKSATLLTLCLILTISASLQLSIHAQGRRDSLPRVNAPQNPPASAVKIETAGGPKTENRAVHGKSGILTASEPDIAIAGDSGTVMTEDAKTPSTSNLSAAKRGNLNAAKTAATYYVGIIPGANGCPTGSDPVTIYMDDEDEGNANSSTGWIGATVQDVNTGFKFCRVDGTLFPTPTWTNVAYAVLQLDTACPPASIPFSRYFDNEDDQNNNGVSGAYLAPNVVTRKPSGSKLNFCLFSPYAFTPVGSQFPNLGVEYGVFASSDFPGLDSGYIHIDDEDDDNTNSYGGGYLSMIADTSKIISGDINTDIHFVKVKSGAPTYGKLHSVSLNVSSVKGGDSCNDIVITVSLDGPARPGGQRVYLSSSNPSVAWIFNPYYFTIPEGQWSESASCFMGTKNVKSNKTVSITAMVNGEPGYMDLDIRK